MLQRFDEEVGTANALVSWHRDARDALGLALSRIRGGHLAWVADRLSYDLGRYRVGFPDLFVTCPHSPGFALYEIEGPGDQLRPEQRGWLAYFADGGIDARVLDVRIEGAPPGPKNS